MDDKHTKVEIMGAGGERQTWTIWQLIEAAQIAAFEPPPQAGAFARVSALGNDFLIDVDAPEEMTAD